jgi:hypothetical protein
LLYLCVKIIFIKMQVSLNIPNQATFDALLPLLQHLNIDFSITEKTVAEPAAAYSVESRRKKLATKLLPKDPNFNPEETLQLIKSADNPNFNLEEWLDYLKECRTDRPLPFRD